MNYPNPHGPGCPWYAFAQTQGAPNIKWCEETLCHWVSEPANTWSNLGYLIVGITLIIVAFKKNHNSKLHQFGPIIFFMGAMSFFYHQSNFYGSQILDFVGMFLFVGWALGMNLIRLGQLKSNHLLPFNLILCCIYSILMHWMYLNGLKFQGIILISALMIVGTEILAQKKRRTPIGWFIAAILTLIGAFSFSIADGKRLWCDPTQHGWFSQGHALWHWVASLAMFFIYQHYSQEKLSAEDRVC
jgi:hypothetical protein